MEWLFNLLGGAVQSVTAAYLIRNFPGILLILGGICLALTIAWKHRQTSSQWRFNPRQVMDFSLLFFTFFMLGMGTYLLFFWKP